MSRYFRELLDILYTSVFLQSEIRNIMSYIFSSYLEIVECPLTDQDFLNGRDIDMSRESSDGRSFHEHGEANYQGDIDLNPEQYEVFVEGKPRGRALQLIGHWPREGSVVNIPYIITACDFTDDEKAVLARAIEEYKNKTCLRY